MHSIFRPPINWRHRRFRYRLVVWRCLNCGAVHHNATKICRRCRSNRLAEDQLPSRARLLTYTVVKNPPVAFERQAPYIVGVVEFEDGTRLLTGITDCEPEELKPGMELERVVRRLTEDGESGLIVYGYRFRPVLKKR
ncbi:MAG: Zn-ribbon domain-containing OB-fold protein [Nitrososphaerota archaeon]|nr:Zn-ribbon domain-containing OB-fold protein [Candidatus Calditenuaceae archaeon]MDW8073174.1 Zn-ribbon domain-containing OB-fold protein [Nitrososphaerota archaeon]